jgi:hypothetical protein
MTTATESQWLMVPADVQRGYIKYAHVVRELVKEHPDDPHQWNVETEWGTVKLAQPSYEAQKVASAAEAVAGIMNKPAPLAGPANLSASAQSIFGGPNPTTALLLGAALGGGLGYGGGKLLSLLLPDYFEKHTGRAFMPLGALLGAAPGMFYAGPNLMRYGAKGMMMPSPLQGGEWPKTAAVLERLQVARGKEAAVSLPSFGYDRREDGRMGQGNPQRSSHVPDS